MKGINLRKILAFLTLLTFQSASAQCYNPCDEWYGCCFMKGYCRPGFYLGAEFGHSWIKTPKLGDMKIIINEEVICSPIKGARGDFSWGVFGGYNSCFWLPGFYVGFEAGYHHNGSSTFFATENVPITNSFIFSESFKCCKIYSHDWNISATFDYVFCCCIDTFFKIGAASVNERFTTQKNVEDERTLKKEKENLTQWAPVINIGFGYCIYDFLKATLSYRGIYCKNHKRFDKTIALEGECSALPRIALDSCSSVNSVYGGLTFTF